MTIPTDDVRVQAQADTRANLFYFLQSLPAGDKGHKTGVEFPISDDVIPAYQRQNGFVS